MGWRRRSNSAQPNSWLAFSGLHSHHTLFRQLLYICTVIVPPRSSSLIYMRGLPEVGFSVVHSKTTDIHHTNGRMCRSAQLNLLQIVRTRCREHKKTTMDTIHDKAPRETAGRITVSRFRMQFQAAAYAALEILSGKDVDRVYCDYQDDFVVRRIVDGVVEYHFFQVKTKGRANQQWKIAEVFSLKQNGSLDTEEKLEAIRQSMAGKLFVHTVEFGEQCREITILSNVHFDDGVHNAVEDLSAGSSSKKYIHQFIEKFAEIVSPGKAMSAEDIEAARKKLTLHGGVTYIGDTLEEFSIAAHNAIWKHSEIELHKHEIDEIANSLVTLVTKKSCAPISGLSKADIDLVTSVGLDDLLKVLSC